MKKPIQRILLTGDDGHNSIGTRTLIHFLKNDFTLFVVGTLDQQSGVGGKMTLSGGAWGETTLDGVPTVWVNGGPVDAIEVAQAYFEQPFDLVISGINFGANIGGSLNSSGTFAAAFRALHVGLSPRAIVLSWKQWVKHSLENHTGKEDIREYIEYPGKAAYRIIRKSIEENMWGSTLLNVNFPTEKSNRVRFTKPLEDLRQYFYFPLDLDRENHHFSYPDRLSTHQNLDITNDTGALFNGYISVSPCQQSFLDEQLYKKVSDLTFTI